MRLNRLTCLTFLTAFLWMESAMAIEEASYDVLISQAPFELRHYAPTLIAQTVVNGDMDAASNQGFRLIADFIFGNNVAPGSEQAKKIAMTAPVTVEPQSGEARIAEAKQWRIQFVMPQPYTLNDITKPVNSAVNLRELPRKYVVVHRYSGLNTFAKWQLNGADLTTSPSEHPLLCKHHTSHEISRQH